MGAGRTLGPLHLLIASYVGIAIVLPFLLVFAWKELPRIAWDESGVWWAVLSGLLAGTGFPLFYLALNTGQVSRAVVVTSAYPAVTVLLAAAALGEPLSPRTLACMLPVIGG